MPAYPPFDLRFARRVFPSNDPNDLRRVQHLAPSDNMAASAAFPILTPLEPPEAQAATELPFPVHFRHPAYSTSTPPLLALFATDGTLDYDLALVCCCILAAVSWDKGHLALRQQGVLKKVQRPSDGLLRGREYLFCLEDVDISGKESLARYICCRSR